jgi:hypothetical protein
MATTLLEALESLNENDKLSDGAVTWDRDNLIEALLTARAESDEGEEFLQQDVAVTSQGIFRVKDDGYLESTPIYCFRWPEDEDTEDD